MFYHCKRFILKPNMWLIITGLFVHVVFLLSIFDIYFTSPIIMGIHIQENNVSPPAKRLILFIDDGLRADSFFEVDNGVSKSPFLRSVLETKGVWGVSHCRIPTESRPGHVALIAGFYEDPSAVFKGWKENPVEFDSIFNQSSVTYSWGSPDILPMFSKGASEGRIFTHTYSAELENFSGRNSSALQLNDWVFEKFEEFLQTARNNSSLKESLNKDGVIFFLHLLGTDVAGHANKPYSREYKETIENADKGIERVVKLAEQFFENDNKTVFIFTSDHGMTDWGSHGAGSPSETETPILAWGPGLAGPENTNTTTFSPTAWGLNQLLRRDIKQADMVPLMAVLLGIPIPVHSLGTLPLNYLDVDERVAAEGILLNCKQLLHQFRRHRETVEQNSLRFVYKPYSGLSTSSETEAFRRIENLIQDGQYEKAVEESKVLISLALEGLKYYQNYYQNFLLATITTSYLGWAAWLSVQLLPQTYIFKSCRKETKSQSKIEVLINIIFLFLYFITVLLLYVQKLPVQYYFYCCLPLGLWWAVSRKYFILIPVISYVIDHQVGSILRMLIYSVGIELLVMTFFYRSVLCLVLFGLGLWPFLDQKLKHRSVIFRLLWFFTCLALAAFPVLPTVGSLSNINHVIMSGWLWLTAGVVLTTTQVKTRNTEDCLVSIFQLSLFPMTVWIVSSTSDSFDMKLGLPFLNQIISWSLLVVCIIVPLLSSEIVLTRLASISLGLAVPFLLLSVGHEAFFLLVLSANLFCWLTLENMTTKNKVSDEQREEDLKLLTSDDLRRAFFFLCYIILSFFGTGNIASINSFNTDWVRCFITSFSPFTMTALILLKTLAPFLLVACSFQALSIILKVQMKQLFYIILILSNLMGLHFLYAVTNEGSWLQIGTSISHYVIMQTMILFIVVLYSIACFYMQTSLWNYFSFRPKLLPAQSLESRAANVKLLHKSKVWSPFDKRHVE